TCASRASCSAASTQRCTEQIKAAPTKLQEAGNLAPPPRRRPDSPARAPALSQSSSALQLALPRIHSFSEVRQLIARHQLSGAREHLLLLFFRVMEHQLLEHLRLRL